MKHPARSYIPLALLVLALVGWLVFEGVRQGQRNASPPPSTTVATSTTTTAKDLPASTHLCEDATGDGGAVDITSVTLTTTGGLLTATWQLASPPPAGTTSYILTVANPDGSKAGQLGAKYQGTTKVAQFVYDMSTARQENVTTPGWMDGTTVSASFPLNSIHQFGNPFTWRATTTQNGNDVDTCPAPGADAMNPKKLAFSY